MKRIKREENILDLLKKDIYSDKEKEKVDSYFAGACWGFIYHKIYLYNIFIIIFGLFRVIEENNVSTVFCLRHQISLKFLEIVYHLHGHHL